MDEYLRREKIRSVRLAHVDEAEISSHYRVRNGIPNPLPNGIPLRNQSWQELRQGDQPALITKSLDVAPSSKSSSSHDNRRSEVAQPHLSGFEPRQRPASIIINLFSSKYIHKRVASAGRAAELRHFTRSSSFRWWSTVFRRTNRKKKTSLGMSSLKPRERARTHSRSINQFVSAVAASSSAT